MFGYVRSISTKLDRARRQMTIVAVSRQFFFQLCSEYSGFVVHGRFDVCLFCLSVRSEVLRDRGYSGNCIAAFLTLGDFEEGRLRQIRLLNHGASCQYDVTAVVFTMLF